jgi:hypothetical protein
MAIKLADVLENVERQLPVVDPRSRSITGLYIGSAGAASAVQLEPQYSSSVFQGVKTSNNGAVAFTSSAGGVAQIDGASPILVTDRGGIITAYDDANSRLHAYMLKSVVDGDDATTAANRSSSDKFQELVSQFDVYPEIAAEAIIDTIENSGADDFWLSGYDTIDKRHYKVSASTLISFMASYLAQDLIDNGITDIDSVGGSGVIGDFNGDGLVNAADLTTFLSYYNTNTTNSAFITQLFFLTGSNESATISSIPALTEGGGTGTGGNFVLSDFTPWYFGASVQSDTTQLYGWDSVTVPAINATGLFVLNTNSVLTAQYTSLFANKYLKVDIDIGAQPTSAFQDLQVILYVKLDFEDGTAKEQAYLIGRFGSLGQSWGNISGEFLNFTCSFSSDNIINNAGNVTPITYTNSDAGMVYTNDAGDVFDGGDADNLAPAGGDVVDLTNTAMNRDFNMAWDVSGSGSGYLEDISLQVVFQSLTGGFDVKVNTFEIKVAP